MGRPPPDLSASAARYRPTGHPSVCRTSSASSLSASSTPAPSIRTRASGSSIARSSTPISTTEPRARRLANGTGGWPREASTSWPPAGTWTASSAMASRHWWLWSRSVWSSANATGSTIPAMVVAMRRATVAATDVPGGARVRKTSTSIGWTRSRAAAIYARSTAGSLSSSSIETHATRRGVSSAHWLSSADLPYPGGPTTETTGASGEARSRSSRPARRTEPGRDVGGRSFDSSRRYDGPNQLAASDCAAGAPGDSTTPTSRRLSRTPEGFNGRRPRHARRSAAGHPPFTRRPGRGRSRWPARPPVPPSSPGRCPRSAPAPPAPPPPPRRWPRPPGRS